MFGCSVLPDCEIVRAGVWLFEKVKSFNNSVCVIGGCLKDKGVDPGIRYCKTFDHKLKFAIAICIRNRETVLDVSARKLWTGSSDQVGR